MNLSHPSPSPFHWFALIASASLVISASAADPEWRPLSNGKDLTGWDTYLSKPQPMWDVPGLKHDEKGNYLEDVGVNRDPMKVFTIVTIDDRPAIRISGQGYGVLQTKESFSNYHLRAQVKWGEKRWEPRLTVRRDSGILYHCHGEYAAIGKYWPRSVELQIQENDFGDLYAVGTQHTGLVRTEANPNGKKPLYIYDPKGQPMAFQLETPTGNRAVRSENREKAHGEWNTIEVVCLGDESIHVVNGGVVLRLTKGKRLDGPAPAPLTEGRIALQTECAEVFYRDVEIRPITEIPPEFAEKAQQ